MTEDDAVFESHREMGCTREEFVGWLPKATRYAPLQLEHDKAVVRAGTMTVEIAFTTAPPRRIALLSLPVLVVSFRIKGADAEACREFIRYFDLCTRRGGG
ncbi:MAG: hypothetical protein IPI73_05625 [Betaproteobacteria bacterium]|nr:hypothetical protein [Betaproteobacteria bacterium]